VSDLLKNLDVKLANNLSTYLWYSIKACILQTNPNTLHWFNNRFINVVSYNAHSAPWGPLRHWLKLDYIEHNEPETLFKDMLTFYSYNNNSIRNFDVAQFVKDCINKNKYVQLEVDEYFVAAKDNYYKEHFYHPVLIYGYDEGYSAYHCIGFGKNNVFMKFSMTELELYESAYSAADMIRDIVWTNPGYDVAAVTITRKDTQIAPFDREKFHNSLNQFIHSVPNPEYANIMAHQQDLYLCGYGIDALRFVPRCIRQDGFEGWDVAYLDFIFMRERNLGLYNRMQWYINAYRLSNAKVNETMNEYHQLTKDYLKFHFAALREYIHTKDFFLISSEKRYEMGDQLDELINREQMILDGLITHLPL
jgi:hypothetical protein